jgi:pantoate--beta-alanine ligase
MSYNQRSRWLGAELQKCKLKQRTRQQAAVLNQALKAAAREIEAGQRDVETVKQGMRKLISAQPQATIDYIEINRAEDLGEVRTCPEKKLSWLSRLNSGIRD